MSLSQADRDAIIDAAFNRTKKEFAGEVSTRTSLTQFQVLQLAKTAQERERLAKVLAVVKKATASNTAKAAAIRRITGGIEALVKIADRVL